MQLAWSLVLVSFMTSAIIRLSSPWSMIYRNHCVGLWTCQAFESGLLDLPDFYFTGDDYRFRFQIEAKRRFIGMLREQFTAGTEYDKAEKEGKPVGVRSADAISDKRERFSMTAPRSSRFTDSPSLFVDSLPD
jgi:hypothetical protein